VFKVSPNREVVKRTTGILRYYGMVAKRMRVLEAS
jgi:hypothetical protein